MVLQSFQLMGVQLSMKAALPLAKILATMSCPSSNTRPALQGWTSKTTSMYKLILNIYIYIIYICLFTLVSVLQWGVDSTVLSWITSVLQNIFISQTNTKPLPHCFDYQQFNLQCIGNTWTERMRDRYICQLDVLVAFYQQCMQK